MSLENTGVGGVYFVPGLPHILQKSEHNDGYRGLKSSMESVGADLKERGIERVLYYSTAWLAVLGQMFQAREQLKGVHVDENWYEFGKLEFDLNIDRAYAEKMLRVVEEHGQKGRLVDYAGFPVDTGTIVADQLVNGASSMKAGIVANHVYSDYTQTKALGDWISGISDEKTAVIAVSGLSGHFFTETIDLREDHIFSKDDDQWNQKILGLWESGKFDESEGLLEEYGAATRADFGLKGFGFLQGFLGKVVNPKESKVYSYEAIYGTGAAVVRLA